MPGVEFVPDPDDDVPAHPAAHGSAHRSAHRAAPTRRRLPPRAWLAGGVIIAVVAAVAVIAGRPDRHAPAAARTSTTHSASQSGTPSAAVSTLPLPEQLAFGPLTRSLVVQDNRIYALTPRLIGAVDRDGGTMAVRPTTSGGDVDGQPHLLFEPRTHLLWAVALGGTAISVFEAPNLTSLADLTAPGPVLAATADGNEIWFVTATGLWHAVAGMRSARRAYAATGLVAVAPDPSRKRVLALTRTAVLAYPVAGGRVVRSPHLPFATADDLAVAGGTIWVMGHYATSGAAFRLDPARLEATTAPVQGSAGPLSVLATFGNRIVVAGLGAPGTMSCLNAVRGEIQQNWAYERGAAVALNDRGLLVSDGNGIELRSARECLAGS